MTPGEWKAWARRQAAALGPPTEEQKAVMLRILGPHARAIYAEQVAEARRVFVPPAPVDGDAA